jgi:hypothetical protein
VETVQFEDQLDALHIYGTISTFIVACSDRDLLAATRCRGWTVGDLLFHMTCDAQRALVTFATPVRGAPDVDFATYWDPFQPAGDESDFDHVRRTRLAASTLSPQDLRELWIDTAAAVMIAARRLDPAQPLATQGHVLTPSDFLSTLVVEATIHLLDLTLELPNATAPPPAALRTVRRTLDARLGSPIRAAWDDTTYALKATGRSPLDRDDRAQLGEQAQALPLLG